MRRRRRRLRPFQQPAPQRKPRSSGAHRVPTPRKLLLLTLFLVAQALFLSSPIFRLERVEVAGNQRLQTERVVRQAALAPGPWLWAIHPGEVEKRVQALPGVGAVDVRWALPAGLLIQVTEREPAVLVGEQSASPLWFEADADGVILGPAAAGAKLPRLMVEDPVGVSGRLDAEPIHTVLAAVPEIEPCLPEPVTFYQVDPLGAVTARTTFLGHPVRIVLGRIDENLDFKRNVLAALTAKLEKEKRPVSSIDLRFPMPVLRPVAPPKKKEES